MEEARKHLLDNFQRHLLHNFETYCDTHQYPKDMEGFVTYLIDQEVIHPLTIKRYTIREEFEDIYPRGQCKKTEAVDKLADRFNISARSVWSIIRKEDTRSDRRSTSVKY